jgi:ABC-type Mn2+/Zn2+ transport system ATPase subunit
MFETLSKTRQSIRNKADSPLIVCEHVSCTYGNAPVVEDVYLTIDRGEFVGIVGPSGSGKTTLLKAIIGSQPVAHGSITIDPRLTIGYVPQVETVDWYFPVTVEEVIVMTRTKTKWWPRITSKERADVREVLEKLGIAEVAGRHIRELSGGQQQRVFLARAMFCQPDVLILDEPTSGVDVRTRHEILHLLADLHQEGLTIVLTTHDLNGLAAHLPRVVCFKKTVIADGSPREVLTSEVLEVTYGAPMEVLEHGGMPLVVDHGRVAMRGEGK